MTQARPTPQPGTCLVGAPKTAASVESRAPRAQLSVLPPQLALIGAALGVLLAFSRAAAGEFMAGADFSHVGFFQDRGVVYRDDGVPQDVLRLLKARGLNCVRLRLFTSSPAQAQADPYNHTNNLDYTLPLAVQVKQAGLRLLLDLHYSDTWADPNEQTKPAAWTNLNFPQLEQRIYDYTSNTLASFRAAGALPDYVQVGNEITAGLLWPDGRVGGSYDTPTQWTNLGRLLKAAIRGARDAAGSNTTQVMIHIDRGGDWSGAQWFFDKLLQQQVTFDLIGLSYYPFWHGSLDAARVCLANAAARYGKPVVIAETAFPWTNSASVQGIPATPQGQVEFVARLAALVKSVPANRGAGIFWWGAEYVRLSGVNLAGFHNRSFFDYTGNALPVLSAVGQLSAPVRLEARITGSSLALTWPLSGAGMSLWATTSLAPGTAWMPVTNSVQTTGTCLGAQLPVSPESNRFFRLRTN